MNLSNKTKRELIAMVRELAQKNDDMRRELDSISDDIVPYIAERDIPKGKTVMVRVPKRFKVSA